MNLGCAQCQRASLACTGSGLYPRTTNFNFKKRHYFGLSNVPGKIIKNNRDFKSCHVSAFCASESTPTQLLFNTPR